MHTGNGEDLLLHTHYNAAATTNMNGHVTHIRLAQTMIMNNIVDIYLIYDFLRNVLPWFHANIYN